MRTARVALFVASAILTACTTLGEPICGDRPEAIIETERGAEDIVRLDLPSGVTRLFVRERHRVGFVDFERGQHGSTITRLWPLDGTKVDLRGGLSLVPGESADAATLYVLDLRAGTRVWRLPLRNGALAGKAERYFEDDEKNPKLGAANDLQAVGNALYITRYDAAGLFRTKADWPGIVRVEPGKQPEAYAKGVSGANGIVFVEERNTLVFSDYWNHRLRRFDLGSAGQDPPFASVELPIHPDNLTRRGETLYIAGQTKATLTGLNLFVLPLLPAPSAVYRVRINDALSDTPTAQPELVVARGWAGRAESVAVPVPGGIVLGRIRTPGIVFIECHLEKE